MSKPIFPTLRQFVLSAFLRASPPKPTELVTPRAQRRDLTSENDAWMFDAPRELSAHKADHGQAMNALSGQLSSVRDLLSRISPTAPVPAEVYHGSVEGVIWSDTVLFDGEPAPIEVWGEGLVCEDTAFLFGGDADRDIEGSPDGFSSGFLSMSALAS